MRPRTTGGSIGHCLNTVDTVTHVPNEKSVLFFRFSDDKMIPSFVVGYRVSSITSIGFRCAQEKLVGPYPSKVIPRSPRCAPPSYRCQRRPGSRCYTVQGCTRSEYLSLRLSLSPSPSRGETSLKIFITNARLAASSSSAEKEVLLYR